MTHKFNSFVIFAEMRTGSNFLEMNLMRLDGVTSFGEAFNPFLLGNHVNKTLCGMTIEARNQNPLALLKLMQTQAVGMPFLRFFHDHDPRVLDAILDDPMCGKIILTRNPVESYVSWKIARATNQWRMMNVQKPLTAAPAFDAAEFEARLDAAQQFQITLLHRLQTSGQTAFYLDYEDIADLDVLNGIAAFLGLQDRLKAVDTTLKKQNPGAIEAKVSNPAEMARALSKMDRFNLTRTPNFEPRRNAGVPQYVACDAAQLLFMPVAGAPVANVQTWMRHFGELTVDFDRKSLRKWKEARPNHHSFTVLRHPLARAHAMFCAFLAQNIQPDLRAYLAKFHGLSLPPVGGTFQSQDDFRAAFLVFLQFLKRNLAGQTGLKVIAQFASQTAILQGFSALYVPHVVLREDRLQAGLDRISADLNLHAVPCGTGTEYPQLDALYGPDLEQAARAAYDRDYTGFGFGDWRA